MSDDIRNNRIPPAGIGLFALVPILTGCDLFVDRRESASTCHLDVGVGIVPIWRQLARTRTELAGAKVETAQWQAECLERVQGPGGATEHQFIR